MEEDGNWNLGGIQGGIEDGIDDGMDMDDEIGMVSESDEGWN